jgi:hypothetical protein
MPGCRSGVDRFMSCTVREKLSMALKRVPNNIKSNETSKLLS